MTSEDNNALVRRFYEAFESNDETILNTLLAADLAAYSHHTPGPQNRGSTCRESDSETQPAATRVFRSKNRSPGEFQGLVPSGKQIAVSGITVQPIEGGVIVERRVETDCLAMLQQLGLLLAAADTSDQTEIASPAGRS